MKVCVSCEKDVSGREAVPIREDRIIHAIRTVKKALRIAQMNELYVCSDCMEEHIKKRKSFEKTMLFASILAALLALLVIISPLLSGRLDLWSLFSGFVLAALVFTLPIYFKYAPAVEAAPLPAKPAPDLLVKIVRPEKKKPKPKRKKSRKK